VNLYAAPPTGDVLFEVAYGPADEDIQRYKGPGDTGAIRTLRGRRNRVLLGLPQTADLCGAWPMNEALAPEIAAFQDKWDFYNVRLACSFEPDRNCRFVWARITASLNLEDPTGLAVEPVVAFDLFPRDVTQTRTYKRALSITSSFKFAFAEASVRADREDEVIRYEPEIVGSGLLTDTPAWTFNSPLSRGLIGNKELYLLIKKPKQRTAKVTFTVGADVKTTLGPIPMRRYADDALLNRAYPLLPGR